MAKLIITESMANKLMCEEISKQISVDDVLKDPKFAKKVKELASNDKDAQKEIKKLVAKCVTELFRTLWLKNNFWKDTIERA